MRLLSEAKQALPASMVYNGHREMSLVVAGRKAPQKRLVMAGRKAPRRHGHGRGRRHGGSVRGGHSSLRKV